MEAVLRTLIKRNLRNFELEAATFLAQRLVVESTSAVNVALLADCYIRSNRLKSAIHVLSSPVLSQPQEGGESGAHGEAESAKEHNRFLLAKCYYLTEEYLLAEDALLTELVEIRIHGTKKYGEQMMSNPELIKKIPNGASGLLLLGKICEKENRNADAIHYYVLALKFDAYLWEAFERLCALGAEVHPSCFFGKASMQAERFDSAGATRGGEESKLAGEGAEEEDSVPSWVPVPQDLINKGRAEVYFDSQQLPGFLSYVDCAVSQSEAASGRSQEARSYSMEVDHCMRDEQGTRRQMMSGSCPGTAAAEHENQDSASFKPCFRLREYSSSSVSEMWPVRLNVGRHALQVGSVQGLASVVEGCLEVLKLLSTVGLGLYYLSKYECLKAKYAFLQLPKEHLKTGYILSKLGRASFESCDYKQALCYFSQMQKLAPFSTRSFDYYSSTLWHLKEDFQLSYLAQKAVKINKLCPRVWVVVGNLFSYQKEHDLAIKFFQRAIQLDPSYAYAHTLSGYEVLANEDFDKSMACFKNAIKLDERHYNAYYGLGTLNFRQEKFDVANYYFSRAVSINQYHSTLHCFKGMGLHATQDPANYEEALQSLTTAIQLNPKNAQARFELAKVFLDQGKYEEGLEELKQVVKRANKESSVFALMGEVAAELNRKQEALKYFDKALDLAPNHATKIKATIQTLFESREPSLDI